MTPPPLRVITGDATPDEVAAIVAVVSALEVERQAAIALQTASFGTVAPRSAWVEVSRRAARSVPAARGSWRLSGRVPRRLR